MNTIYYLTAFFIGFLIFSNQVVFNRIREQSQNYQYENPRTR